MIILTSLGQFLRPILCIVLLMTTGHAVAQIDTKSLIEDVFQSGLNSFRQGRYTEALSSFEVVLAGTHRNHRSTAACIMAAKAAYRAGEFSRVRIRTTELLDTWPRSTYADHAYYLRALAEYRLGNYDIAAADLLTLANTYPGSVVTVRSKDLLDDILLAHLPASELQRLANLGLREDLHTGVSYALARTYAREGKDSLAVAVLDGLLGRARGDSVQAALRALREDLTAGEKMKIGVLLPLMDDAPPGDIRRLSDEVYDGIRFAADEYNRSVGPARQVELLVRDTRFTSGGAENQAVEMAGLEGVRAVVGPLFTDEFTAAARAANERFLPIISPTATGDGIAELGPYIFQANPDYATRGRAAARYAVETLGMSSFAILASEDFVGTSHANAFRDEAERLGATVYCTAYFPPESEDLREAYMKIRRSVMAESTLVRLSDLTGPKYLPRIQEYGIGPDYFGGDSSATDSLEDGYLSVISLFGPRGYAVAESLGLPIAAFDTTADETDIPLIALDAIFMALGDPRQMDYVAPQLNYFNIKAQVIGNNEWYDSEGLAENAGYINGLLFVADSYIDPADTAVARFVAGFAARRGRAPTKFTYYGYDTMSLLLDQLRGGARGRAEISRGLSSVSDHAGLHSLISLAGGRVNHNLHVLQFTGGHVVKLGEASGNR